MSRHDVFLSVIYVLNGNLDQLQKTLTNTVQTLSQKEKKKQIINNLL
tara:strand:- start:191 stop:331 length:141 start_codon:yes stop_codon:yes gene_type:complete